MTFSIAARCSRTGQVGVGAVTAMLGVGKLVSHAHPSSGAVATQATLNPYLGIDGLRVLADGHEAEVTLERLVDGDPGRDVRQCGLVDLRGGSAAWTGEQTPPWSGHRTGDGIAVQGNRLVGRETVDAVYDAFLAHDEHDLAFRLLEALAAGEATGADTAGAESATVYVMDTEEYPLWDLRVDAADDPVKALRHLAARFDQELLPQIRKLPTRQDPMGESAREQDASIG